jgi:[protein-PII] uridylyltransferase
VRTLELLHALSIADGEATGKAAWSDWKASLVRDLVERTRRALTDSDYEAQPEFTLKQVASAMNGNLSVSLENRGPVLAIELIIADRTGVLSLIAGVLNILRLDVRAARTKTLGTVAVMEWIVSPDPNAPEVTREVLADTLTRALDGDIDIESKIAARIAAYAQLPSIPVPAPTVETFLDAATDATVIEVRSHDRPALLYGIGGAVADCGIDIRAAIVTTLGAEAIDTLYVTEIGGGALTPDRAHEVESRLSASLK